MLREEISGPESPIYMSPGSLCVIVMAQRVQTMHEHETGPDITSTSFVAIDEVDLLNVFFKLSRSSRENS